jgi:hypothetical protein
VTVQQLIESALTANGRLGQGRGAGASESAVSFVVLNTMLENMNGMRPTIYAIVGTSYSLTSGVMTMGPSGTLATTRPIHIEAANVVSGGIHGALSLATTAEWNAIPMKTDTSQLPRVLYNDGAFPLSTLSFYPLPSGTVSVEIFTWSALAQFATLGDTVTFPPQYLRALTYSLAVELCAYFNIPVLPTLAANMASAVKTITDLNARFVAPPVTA